MASTALALARTPRRRLAALAVLLALVVSGLAAALTTSSAGAAPSATLTGVVVGADIFGVAPSAPGGTTVDAGMIELQLDGESGHSFAYSLEFNQPNGPGSYEGTPWASVPVDALSTVRYILSTYGPSQGFLNPDQAAGIQAAVWHVTDDYELGGTASHPSVPGNGNSSIATDLYDAILADLADGFTSLPEPAADLTVTRISPFGDPVAGDVSRFTVSGNLMSGIVVTLAPGTTGAFFVDCTTLAPATPVIPNGGDVCVQTTAAGTFTIGASGQAETGLGTVLVHPDAARAALMLVKYTLADADGTLATTVIPDEGSITVTKLVEGSSGFEAAWTFVLRDNSGAQVGAPLEVNAANPVGTFTGLPTAGSPYTITEIGSSATSTIVSSSGVTVTPGGNAQVSVTNRYEGRFTITKVVTGDLTPPAGTTYEFEWACTAPGGAPTGSATDIFLAAGSTYTSPLILAGSSCAVTEVDANGGTPSIQVGAGASSPGAAVTVTISHAGPQAITVTNAFPEAARLTVNKATTGPVTGPFEVTVACTFNGAPVTTGAEGGVAFSPASPWVSPLLPVGSECTVTETGQGNAETVSVTPTGAANQAGDIFTEVLLPAAGETVTFTNSRAPLQATGQLTVSKAVTGTVTGTFMFTVACPGVTLPADDAAFTLAAGTSRTLGVTIPAGTTCTVTEVTRGDAASTTVSVNGGTAATVPGPQPSADVTITIDATATVAFTNVREVLPTTTTTTAPPTTTTTVAPTTTTTTPPTPSSAAATSTPTTAAQTSSGTLAFTGGSVGLLLLAGGAMLALGLVFRLSTRRRIDA
jgi:hypothetical protein